MSKWDAAIDEIMDKLGNATADDVGVVMASKGVWAPGISARNNAAKILKGKVALGHLRYASGMYFKNTSRSEGGQHDRLLSQALSKTLATFHNSLINREILVSELGCRPDALVLLVKNDEGCAIVLECVHTEKAAYFAEKVRKWRSWPDALPYLSQLFGYKVSSFEIVRSDQLDAFLKEASR